ncbi:MAG: hypothetical protein AB8B69_22320 [Chitinophagales bacterium]
MQNTKLLQLLRTFDQSTISRWQQFAHSPYHNKHRDVRTLCNYLHKIYPKLEGKKIERKQLFLRVWGRIPFLQKKLNVLFTYTLSMTEDFLVHERFRQETDAQHIYLLEQLRQRQQQQRYEHHLQKIEKHWHTIPVRNRDYYHFQFRLAVEKDSYYNQLSQHSDQSIQHKQDSLDSFYLSEKLRDACEMSLRNQLLQVEYSVHLLEAILQEIRQYPERYQAIPSIMVYFQIYQMIDQQDSTYYFELIQVLRNHATAFPKEELRSIYAYAQNHCIGQINKGKGAFLGELFELYKTQLQSDLLLEKGYLSEWHYKNIVTVGLRLKAFEWVAAFIEGYREKLPLQARDNAHRFNKAAYFYSIEEYGDVLQLLLTVEYSDIRYSLDAKSLLLKSYYDLEENETLFALCDAFRQYLKRNKEISDFRKEGYYNLLKFTQKAARIRESIGFEAFEKLQKEVDKLQAEIEAMETIFNVNWLKGKVEILKNDFVK